MVTNKRYWDTINSGYTATPASTSTITTTVDLRSKIRAGDPLRYDIAGVYYYGVVTTMAAALITIAGAPMGGDIVELCVGNPSRVIVKDYHFDAAYTTVTDQTKLESFHKWDLGDLWQNKEARLVRISHCNETNDATSQPDVNMYVDTAAVSTANTNQGQQVGASPAVVHTVVDINTTNYVVAFGSRIEIGVADHGGGLAGAAAGLSVWGTFVLI